jgi:hypothetical protein
MLYYSIFFFENDRLLLLPDNDFGVMPKLQVNGQGRDYNQLAMQQQEHISEHARVERF